MSLSNTIQTIELEPVLFTQDRAEFRFPVDKVVLQNIRLANLGLSCNYTNAPLNYAYNVGAYQIIKNIYLYHNNLVLAQVKDVPDWMAFRNLQADNDANLDMTLYVNKSRLGFEFASDGKIAVNTNAPHSTISSSTNRPSLLPLTRIFSFLEQIGYINTYSLRHLRLVMEFNSLSGTDLNYNPVVAISAPQASPTVITLPSDAKALGFEVGQTTTFAKWDGNGWDTINGSHVITVVNADTISVAVDSTSGSFTGAVTTLGSVSITNFNSGLTLSIERPYLLMDEIINAPPAKYPVKAFSYASVELETISVADSLLTVNKRLNAWNNKNLLRLLMVNRPLSSTDLGIRKYQSLGMYNEVWNFYLNGKQLVPNQGIDNPVLKQSFLVNAWGEVNVPQGSQDVRNQLQNSNIYSETTSSDVENANLCGNLSYGGLLVNSPVSKLEVYYEREQYPDASIVQDQSTQAFNMAIYGEVQKTLTMQNGEPVVVG
jgi:hypothetical protein